MHPDPVVQNTSSSSRHQKGLLRRHNQQQHANRLWVTCFLMCPAWQHVLHPEGTVWEAFQHTRSFNNETKEFQPEGKWQHQEDTQTAEVIDSVHKRRAVSLGRNERPCPLFPANMTKPTVVTTNAAGKKSSESDWETHQSLNVLPRNLQLRHMSMPRPRGTGDTETGRLTLGVSRTACSISSLSLPSVSYNMSISREGHLPVQDWPKKNGQCLPSLLNSVLASATKRIQDMTSILKTSSGIQDVFKLSCTSKVRSFISWGNYLPCLPISPDPFVSGMAFFP